MLRPIKKHQHYFRALERMDFLKRKNVTEDSEESKELEALSILTRVYEKIYTRTRKKRNAAPSQARG